MINPEKLQNELIELFNKHNLKMKNEITCTCQDGTSVEITITFENVIEPQLISN